ncbi:MAG: PAS domain S-box protein [Thermonemataceae bacterium]
MHYALEQLTQLDKKQLVDYILRLQETITAQTDFDALAQANAALQDLFDNANDLIFVCSVTGNFLFFNKVFRERLGYENEALRHMNLHQLIHANYQTSTSQQFSKILVEEKSLTNFHTALVSKNGETVYLAGRASARFEESSPTAIRYILYDITERVRMEGELLSQSARLKAIFESDSHIMWTVNRQRQFTSFNKNYIKTLQVQYGITPTLYERSDRLKQALKDEKKDTFWKKHFKKAFAGEVQHFEIKVSDINGNPLWRDVYLNPIFSVEGAINEVSAIAHDITEKKLSEFALKESEEKFRSIFESFQDIYYRSDLKGYITMISPSIQELGGYTPKEMIGKRVLDFYATKDPKRNTARQAVRELFRKGRIKNFEMGLRCKDGTVVQSLSNIRLIYDEIGFPIAIEGVIRDITELKKASEEAIKAKELAERSLKVKESFLANMSHEIRTPMNGVIGMIDLLGDTQLNTKQQDYVQTIKKSSETLMHILNDILDLSKIEAGKMILHKKSIAVKSLVDKVYHLFLPQANSKQNELTYSVDERIPPYIWADETRLLQVMTNLLSNAIKFTEKGKVTVALTLLTPTVDFSLPFYIKATIQDTGVVSASEDLEKLFSKFSQLDHSSTKAFSGTGLGLAISKQLTELMEGDIGVTSSPKEGSTFWFTFKTRASTQLVSDLEQAEEKSITQLSFIEKTPHILVVDDNAINRKVAAEILTQVGSQVVVAQSGQEAIEKVQQSHYDIILMDIQMPDMDGIVTTQHIKALNLPTTPPIIAMTAYSMNEDEARFLAQGLDGYIAKPIKATALVEKVKSVLGLQTSPRATITLPDTDNFPLLDREVVQQLSKYGGITFVRESLVEFVTEATQQLARCRQYSKQQDYEAIRKELHTLKGNAGTLGVAQLAQQATLLEKSLKSQVPQNLNQQLIGLEDSLYLFKVHYDKILEET